MHTGMFVYVNTIILSWSDIKVYIIAGQSNGFIGSPYMVLLDHQLSSNDSRFWYFHCCPFDLSRKHHTFSYTNFVAKHLSSNLQWKHVNKKLLLWIQLMHMLTISVRIQEILSWRKHSKSNFLQYLHNKTMFFFHSVVKSHHFAGMYEIKTHILLKHLYIVGYGFEG